MKTLTLLMLLLGAPLVARSQSATYFTRDALLRQYFATSEYVTYTRLRTADHANELRRRLGYVPRAPHCVIFIGMSGEKVDGYAIIDDEPGQHQPITLATLLDAAGFVRRSEVMIYREGHGHEIREARFRRQFVGKGPADPLRAGDDIVAVSGATISSRAMARAVRRAVAWVALQRGQTTVAPLAAARAQP